MALRRPVEVAFEDIMTEPVATASVTLPASRPCLTRLRATLAVSAALLGGLCFHHAAPANAESIEPARHVQAAPLATTRAIAVVVKRTAFERSQTEVSRRTSRLLAFSIMALTGLLLALVATAAQAKTCAFRKREAG